MIPITDNIEELLLTTKKQINIINFLPKETTL